MLSALHLSEIILLSLNGLWDLREGLYAFAKIMVRFVVSSCVSVQRWRAAVLLQVQHSDMKGLMDSDVRNLGRLAHFVKGALPFDVFPVCQSALLCRTHCVTSC